MARIGNYNEALKENKRRVTEKQNLLKELERVYTLFKIEIFTDMTEETVIQFESGEKMELPRNRVDIKHMQKELKNNC